MTLRFADRRDAGRRLARALAATKLVDPVVLALPRGGVPVAAEVARALGAPLDLLLVRKIGAPGQRELAVAAIAEGPGDTLVLDAETMAASGASQEYVEHEADRERTEIARRRAAYLSGRAPLAVAGQDGGRRRRRHRHRHHGAGRVEGAAPRAVRRAVVLAVPVAPSGALGARPAGRRSGVPVGAASVLRRRRTLR